MAVCLLVTSLAGCGSTSNTAGQETITTEAAASEEGTTVSAETETAAETADAEITADAFPLSLTDQAGREVTLEAPARNLVSSYYISTALLIALGCADNLSGIEMKADTRMLYQLAAPQLLSLPAVGSGKGINVEETAALSPDLVILPLRLLDSAASFEELGIPVLVVNPETQEDFEACVELLGAATGTQERAAGLLAYYHEKMEEAEALTTDLERPDVYFASGSDYLRTCTSQMYQNDLIRMAGGRSVSEELTDGYWQNVSPEQVLAWNPEYIFCVTDADYTLEDVKQDETLAQVQAVQDGHIMSFPSPIEAWDYPTPSSVLGVLWLTCQLHPEVYSQEDFVKEAKAFYQEFFSIEVTEEQLGL